MSSINRNFFITRAETVTVMIANSLRLPSFRWSQDLPNQVPAHAFTIWHCVCRDCCGAWKGWKWWILLRCGSTFLRLSVDGTYLHFHTQLCVAKTFTRRELCFCLPTQNATNIMLPAPQKFNEEKKWVNDFPTTQKRAFVISPLCQEVFPLVEIHDSARRNGFCLLTLVKNGCDVIFYKVDFFFALSSSKNHPWSCHFKEKSVTYFHKLSHLKCHQNIRQMMNELRISPIAEIFLQHESSLKCHFFAKFTADLVFSTYFNISDSQESK